MADYKLQGDGSVIRAADSAVIPNADGNRDWEAYQQWLADGGVPDPYKPPLDVDPLNIRTTAQILGVEK
ncbi:hypothetical protein QA640_32325 [Bradyrhizobium sp. CB82]|uniref:hypothetical protein n=1 Tax=Bradyrhizobium sp. CB82 TaxID=3039159 RepID=UPI0024B05EDC|nr:hypothetical protein [Bradyrhizobium sp. CB82]WFU39045.1 hypothetical protein QA640_32325 [Bradyrhizobium sp. CB82]